MTRTAAVLFRVSLLTALYLGGCSESKSAGSVSAGAEISSDAGSDASAVRSVTVDDPVLKMVAFTAKIPKSWKFTGMIAYPGGCHPPQIPADGLTYTALAPDGITAVEKLPGSSWTWNSDGSTIGKCKPVKVESAASFLLNIAVPNLRPDAKDVTVVPLPAKLQQAIDEDNKRQPQSGPMDRRTMDAARVHVAYTYKDHPVEEMLFVIVGCQELDSPAYPALHRPANQRHLCRTGGVNIRRAPRGALDALSNQELQPPQINPQWDAAVSERMRTQFAAMQKANDEQFQAIQNHFKQVNNQLLANGRAFQDQQKQSFNNAMAQDRATQGSIDHAAQMQVRNSLNRQVYVNPSTGQRIETSDQYTHSWISSDGQSVVLNGDPTFDPNGLVDPVRQSWTELIPTN
jgi:hypothetical protein